MGEVELEAEVRERALNVVVEPDVEDVGDDEAADEVVDGVDEPLAELGEMLHQAHAGEFGAVGYGFACLVDRVEISHAGWPRWPRLPLSCCRIGIVRDGVENGRECGVADRKAG